MNNDGLLDVTEEVLDIQGKLRGVYELLEILQTAEEQNRIPYPDALFQIMKMTENILDQVTSLGKSLSGQKTEK